MKRREFVAGMGAGAAGALLTPMPSVVAAEATRRMAPVRARQADALCTNYLINTKIYYARSVYRHTHAVMDLLTELGVRIIRERVTTGRSHGTRNQLYAMPALARRGIRWHGTVGTLTQWPHADAANREVMTFLRQHYASRVGGDLRHLVHSLGGCNEIDGSVLRGRRDPHWAPHARRMQRALFEQAKAHPATAHIPIAGPSTRTDVTRQRAHALGNLSRWCDLGNGHLYGHGTSPTRHLDRHLRILEPCFPGVRRYLMTETGYNNSPQSDRGRSVPEFASAVYAVRGICDYFKRNVVYGRFELLDDPDRIDRSSQHRINATADWESHFGLVAMTRGSVRDATPNTWRKKPEFHATKRLLHLLADRGPDFTPRPLRMSMTVSTEDVQQLLLQKRNGKHYLLLWRDVEVARAYPSGRRIDVAPARVHVTLATARPFRVWGPNRRCEPLRTHSARRSIGLDLRGDLMVVEIG